MMQRTAFISENCARAIALALALLAILPLAAQASQQTVSLSSAPIAPPGQADDAFDIANEEYKAGNLENAIRIYQNLLSGSKGKKADIHYNLGNAYFKLGKYGKAIVAYRRALNLSPRDPDILSNLRYVGSLARDKIDQPRNTELFHELLFFHYGTSRTEAEAIFLIAYSAAALFGALCLFYRRRPLRILLYVSLVPALAFGSSVFAHALHSKTSGDAVVVAETADAHTGPGDSYVLSFSLHDGAETDIRRREAGWAQIEISDGRRGWLKESQIETVY